MFFDFFKNDKYSYVYFSIKEYEKYKNEYDYLAKKYGFDIKTIKKDEIVFRKPINKQVEELGWK